MAVVVPILNAAEAMRLDLGPNIRIDPPAREQRFAGPAEIPHGKGRNRGLTPDPVTNPMADGVLNYGYLARAGKEPLTPKDPGFIDSSIEYGGCFR